MSRNSSIGTEPHRGEVIVWWDFPDPRTHDSANSHGCTVEFEEQRWRHIVEKHVSHQEEAWDDWLTPELAGRLRRAWAADCTEAVRRQTLQEASDLVEMEARDSLNVPLAVLYDNYQAPKSGRPSHGQETWALVLPAGALLIIRSRPDSRSVCTCYFLKSALRCAHAGQQWRDLVRTLLSRYAELTPEGSWISRELVQEGQEIRTRIRFRTPVTWGMDGHGRRPWDVLREPWRGGGRRVPPAGRLGPRPLY